MKKIIMSGLILALFAGNAFSSAPASSSAPAKKNYQQCPTNKKQQELDDRLIIESFTHDRGCIKRIKKLFKSGANINARASSIPVESLMGCTVLRLAACMCSPEVVRFLIDSGAKVNMQDDIGLTALMAAAMSGNSVNIYILLGAPKIDIDAQDMNGNTALMWAVRSGKLKGIKALLDAGAKIDTQNNVGETAISIAKKKAIDSGEGINKQDSVVDMIYRYTKKHQHQDQSASSSSSSSASSSVHKAPGGPAIEQEPGEEEENEQAEGVPNRAVRPIEGLPSVKK